MLPQPERIPQGRLGAPAPGFSSFSLAGLGGCSNWGVLFLLNCPAWVLLLFVEEDRKCKCS